MVATLSALLTVLLGVNLLLLLRTGSLPLHISLLLGASALVILFITRQPAMLGITTVPLLGWAVARFARPSLLLWTCFGLLGLLLGLSSWLIRRNRLMAHAERTRRNIRLWRFLVRPAAMAFPVLLTTAGRGFTLVLLGAVTFVFLAMDITRLSAGRVNLFLFRRAGSTFKPGERARLSSMTGFLLAMLTVMLVFDATVAWYAVAFLVFGDFAARYFGLQYGRTRLFGKTLEGSLAHLLACVATGFIIHQYLPAPLPAVLLGALAATVFELPPLGIDDNLTAALAGATTLHFTRNLFTGWH